MRTCCQSDRSPPQPGAKTRSPTAKRRMPLKMTAWVLPAGILLVVPKCPLCLAAYVMLCTGVALSAPAATRMRWLLIVLGGCALILMAAHRLYCWYRSSHPFKQENQHAEPHCHAR